jgi:hypothetical protein
MHQKGMSAGRCPRHAIVRLFAAVSRLGCVRPNGLAFSCRERAGKSLQKANDLARAAVNCNAGLGRRIVAVWHSDAENSCSMARHDGRVWHTRRCVRKAGRGSGRPPVFARTSAGPRDAGQRSCSDTASVPCRRACTRVVSVRNVCAPHGSRVICRARVAARLAWRWGGLRWSSDLTD